jgi:intergrase/recombinase
MTLNRPTCRICGNADCDHKAREYIFGNEQISILENKVANLTKCIFEMNDKINALKIDEQAYLHQLNHIGLLNKRFEGLRFYHSVLCRRLNKFCEKLGISREEQVAITGECIKETEQAMAEEALYLPNNDDPTSKAIREAYQEFADQKFKDALEGKE